MRAIGAGTGMRMSGLMMAQATGGDWIGAVPGLVAGCAIDSRRVGKQQAFVALRGPNHDGHAFAAALDGQVAALVGEHGYGEAWRGLTTPKLLVKDSYQALIDLAAAWRQQLPASCRVVAVVGSQGKTTLRRMVAHLLQAAGQSVAQTEGNLNNLIGTPLTLLAIPAATDVAVVECGISEPGEMARLAAMVRPDVVVVPALSLAHSEGLHDLETIVHEKALMAQAASSCCVAGTGVTALFDQFGVRLHVPVVTQAVAWQLSGHRLELCHQGMRAALTLPWPATHMAANMALAATVVHQLQPQMPLDAMAEALQSWQPMAGRMRLLAGRGGCRLLDDSYNANPASMQAALDTLRAMDGRTTAVLGDMGELGALAAAAHRQLHVTGIDCLLLIGQQMRALAAQQPQAIWFTTTGEALAALDALPLTANDVVLVKGSRMMGLERVVASLSAGAATQDQGDDDAL
ncbi:MAG: UDP-N-acetylmuramoyl-tripeptide--D-alanyl-D-alanine ligase [Mariprofundales bacterium]